MRTKRGTGVALAVGALLAPGCESHDDYRMDVAEEVFDRNCAECHGSLGGGGPEVADPFGTRAPDLRLLSRKYGSPLPRDQIVEFIDGRREVEAHGPRTMPVWGDRLYDNLPGSETVEEMKAGTIELLVDYIEKHQTG